MCLQPQNKCAHSSTRVRLHIREINYYYDHVVEMEWTERLLSWLNLASHRHGSGGSRREDDVVGGFGVCKLF